MVADYIYTISARGKTYREPVAHFLAANFADIPPQQIDSLFGFVEPCTLYGGRPYQEPQFSNADVLALYAAGIGLRLPLTNHYVDEAEYARYHGFFEKYHRDGNSIITHSDELAKWIRRDWPRFKLESSVIKNINTYAKIDKALKLYDTVVIPMELNQNEAFLRGIPDKTHITLFANAGCALNCPNRICYRSISKINKFQPAEFKCSKTVKERDILGMVDFDIEALASLGFRRFKLLRSKPNGITAF